MGFVLKLSDVNLYCFDNMLISQHFLSVSSEIDYLFVQNIWDLEITAVGQTRFLSSSNLHSVGDSVSFEIMHPFQHCGIVSDCSHSTDKLEFVPSSFSIYSLIKVKASLLTLVLLFGYHMKGTFFFDAFVANVISLRVGI